MSLPGYDTWLLPRERSGWFDVRCEHEPATCFDCGHRVPEPVRVVLYEPRKGERPPLHLKSLKGVLDYRAERCPACGSEQFGPETCGEEWTSKGNWVEGAGVELLTRDKCEKCGGSDRLEVEDAEGDGPC